MTTFSFSTGNPSNLVGGATASMTDISGSLTDVKTFLNGGSITDTNVTAGGLTDTSLASPTNAVWRTVLSEHGQTISLTTGTFYYNNSSVASASGSSQGGIAAFWVPPVAADIAVAGKTTRLRLRIAWGVNATSSGINATWGLYPINSLAGAGVTIAPTLGTVVAGSTVNAPTLTAGSAGVATGTSFDFSAVTAGSAYCIGVTGSGVMSGSSLITVQMTLEMRHT